MSDSYLWTERVKLWIKIFKKKFKITNFRIELSDSNSAVLLFSTLVRSLKQKTRILLHFYCGITDHRHLPGYVYRNSTFKIELLQHLDCVAALCDRMIKSTMHSNDNTIINSLVTKIRQLLLNCLNLIIGR